MSEVKVSIEVGDAPDTVTITFADLPIDDIDECFAELGTVEGRHRFAEGVRHATSTNDTEGRF